MAICLSRSIYLALRSTLHRVFLLLLRWSLGSEWPAKTEGLLAKLEEEEEEKDRKRRGRSIEQEERASQSYAEDDERELERGGG